jgi:hypothetical protein
MAAASAATGCGFSSLAAVSGLSAVASAKADEPLTEAAKEREGAGAAFSSPSPREE